MLAYLERPRMSSGAKRKEEDIVFRISFKTLSCILCSLPLFGFLVCVGTSLYLHFEGATATHCKVRNYLPSISAAIGGFTPEKYIWRVCVGLHSAPRYMIPFLYYRHFQNSIRNIRHKSAYNLAVWALCLLNAAEITSLVGLTYISSGENRGLHEKCFISFMVCSLVYMLLMCILGRWSRQGRIMSHKESKSLRYKTILFTVNVSSGLGAVYFFIRHNSRCEPGVYTIFAFLEYVIVITNIAFHWVGGLDLEDYELKFTPSSLNGRRDLKSSL